MNKKTLSLIVLSAIIAAGCTVKPRPPLFNLYDRQKMVVMPLENNTPDPALARAVQDGVEAGLVRLNAVPVAEDSAVSALIARQRATNLALEQNDNLRKKIVDSLKADIIMTGVVNTYTEDVREEEPQRIATYHGKDKTTYKWGYNDTVAVNVNATVKLLDANSGNILWVRQASGDGVFRRWKDLAWPGDNAAPPAEGWDQLKGKGKPMPKEQQKPAATQPQAQNPAGTPVATGGGQTINIIVQNVNQQAQGQTQAQEQKQEQKQEQTQTAAAAAPPKLLYLTDSNVMRARGVAINYTVGTILRDYYGVGGWTPTPKTK